MNEIISLLPTLPIGALIAGVSGWIGYKINNSIRMKSEIEDSRIEWIQHVRSVNFKIIQSLYQFIIENNSYLEVQKTINDLEKEQKDLITGLVSQKKRNDEEKHVEKYTELINNNLEKLLSEYNNLDKNIKKSLSAMYTTFSYIEQMKNLFPTDKYSISNKKIKNKNVLIAQTKISGYLKKDESIENKVIFDALNKLKSDIRDSYKNTELYEEQIIDEYAELITKYLKIEWEKVKSRKG